MMCIDVMETLKVSETFRVLNPQVVIASVHPHHGPDTMGLWGPDDKTSGVDADYMSALKKKIAATILASLSDLKPASVSTTSVHVPGLAKNARNPEIVDDELTLLNLLNTEQHVHWSLCSTSPATPKCFGNTTRTSPRIMSATCVTKWKSKQARRASSSLADWAA